MQPHKTLATLVAAIGLLPAAANAAPTGSGERPLVRPPAPQTTAPKAPNTPDRRPQPLRIPFELTAAQQRVCSETVGRANCTLDEVKASRACREQRAAPCRDALARWATAPTTGTAATPPPTPTSTPAPGGAAGEGSVTGDLDPLAGMRSPLCRKLSGAPSRACASSGSPHLAYPIGHYAFDINIETSITSPGKLLSLVLQTLFSYIWLATLYLLHLAFFFVEYMLGLDIIGDGDAKSLISQSLGRNSQYMIGVWGSAIFGGMALWVIWDGLVRRRHTAALSSTLASLAMILVAMVIITKPFQTVGYVSNLSNKSAMGFISAPSTQKFSNPEQGVGETFNSLFHDMVISPWCLLNFADVRWCQERATADERQVAIKAATEKGDVGAAIIASRTGQIGPQQRIIESLSRPQTKRSDLWLSFSPGSGPRTELFKHYAGEQRGNWLTDPLYKDKNGSDPKHVAIQTASGTMTRMIVSVLFSFGLLGGVLLFGWLTIKLFYQVVIGLVLLLATPLVLLMPAFGESGRKAFVRWASTLFGALISKAIYAGFLGIVAASAAIVGTVAVPAQGSATDTFSIRMIGWAVVCMWWWAILVRRNDLLNLVHIGPKGDHNDNVAHMAEAYSAYRIGRGVAGAARGAVGGSRRGVAGPKDGQQKALAHSARSELQQRAHAIGDRQIDEAGSTVALHRALTGEQQQASDQVKHAGATLKERQQAWGQIAGHYQHDESGKPVTTDDGKLKLAGGETVKAPSQYTQLVTAATDYAKAHQRQTRVQQETDAIGPKAQAARRLLESSEENRLRHGARFSPRQLQELGDQAVGMLSLPPTDSQQSWRVNNENGRPMSRTEFAAAQAAASAPGASIDARKRWADIQSQVQTSMAADLRLAQSLPVAEGGTGEGGATRAQVKSTIDELTGGNPRSQTPPDRQPLYGRRLAQSKAQRFARQAAESRARVPTR